MKHSPRNEATNDSLASYRSWNRLVPRDNVTQKPWGDGATRIMPKMDSE